MNTHSNDLNKVSATLKKARGEEHRRNEIPFLETLAGKYTGNNVLEGFAANTEILCAEKETDEYNNDFYEMIIKDNMIIFDITADEEIQIPLMSLKQLKDILFKKLKLNKACDVFKLTVEHLRNVGDESLSLIHFDKGVGRGHHGAQPPGQEPVDQPLPSLACQGSQSSVINQECFHRTHKWHTWSWANSFKHLFHDLLKLCWFNRQSRELKKEDKLGTGIWE